MFCILFGIFSELFLQANSQLIISTTSFYSFLPKNCVLIFFFNFEIFLGLISIVNYFFLSSATCPF